MLGEQEQEGVVLAQRVLVEEHRVRFLSDFLLFVLVFLFVLLKLLLCHDLLVFEVDVEEDLSIVFLQ